MPVELNRRVVPRRASPGGVTVDSARIEDGLRASSNLSLVTGHPGPDIRPCVATMVETSLQKGDYPNRNETAVIIACEFQRIGMDYDTAEHRLALWNQGNRPPLTCGELSRALRNGFSAKYRYSCKHSVLMSFCIAESCPFAKLVSVVRKKVRNHVFVDYGWQRHLSNRQVLIYFVAIPYLEVKRQVGPGGVVFASHRDIAERAGVAARRMGADLKVLAKIGLIEYKVGRPRKWEGIASEVRRIIPIPRPTNSVVKRLKVEAKRKAYV